MPKPHGAQPSRENEHNEPLGHRRVPSNIAMTVTSSGIGGQCTSRGDCYSLHAQPPRLCRLRSQMSTIRGKGQMYKLRLPSRRTGFLEGKACNSAVAA